MTLLFSPPCPPQMFARRLDADQGGRDSSMETPGRRKAVDAPVLVRSEYRVSNRNWTFGLCGVGARVSRTALSPIVPVLLFCILCAGHISSADEPQGAAGDPRPAGTGLTERVQVTATRIPESTDTLPASLTVVTGEDLRLRGA